MASADEFLKLLNCTIRFNAPEAEYEGVVRRVIPIMQMIVVGKLILLPNCRLGSGNFIFSDLSNIRVISRPDGVKETTVEKKHVVPVYPKTEIEKLFDFDNGSDIEDGECDDHQLGAYEMKLVPHLAKFVPKDFDIIDSFNREFNLAIKHIKKQSTIGVSLEGIQVSRSGTLTWLSISTKSCNFLFDILALGERAFQEGLKSILEDANITKIFHDCRLASDCLFHKYGVCLVNVFDTQVADYIVMMQMNPKDKIGNRVNTLDACLGYYLKVPYDYLYGEANLDDREDGPNFHAKRPLQHEIQDVLIKNVMYLHLLQRELELALMIPLRRATDVYLNCVQKLAESELQVVPHQPDELPLDMHLDGIQIFRHKDFEYACSTVASGPPYRHINNPIKSYLNYRPEYKNGQTRDKKSVVYRDLSENVKSTSPELKCRTSVDYPKASKSAYKTKPVEVKSFASSSESGQYCSDDSKKKTPSHSSYSHELPSFKSHGIPVRNNTSKPASPVQPPHPTLDVASSIEILRKLIPKRKSSNSSAAHTCVENSATDNIATSESVCKTTSNVPKDMDSVESISSEELVDDSKKKKVEDISDSEFEVIAARVRARGALVRNRKTEGSASDNPSTCDPFRSVQIKPKKNSGISSGNVETTSEDVILYHRDTLDKPSKLVVTINHKNRCLADLYREAGDHSMQLWNEDSSNVVPQSSPNKLNKPTEDDDFWSRVLGDRSSQPMDEKLRSRLVPAGMHGF